MADLLLILELLRLGIRIDQKELQTQRIMCHNQKRVKYVVNGYNMIDDII